MKTVFREVIVPRKVYEEATLDWQSADSVLISKAVEGGWIKVSEEKMGQAKVIADRSGIHLGEAETILLAQKLRTELIIDEKGGFATG